MIDDPPAYSGHLYWRETLRFILVIHNVGTYTSQSLQAGIADCVWTL